MDISQFDTLKDPAVIDQLRSLLSSQDRSFIPPLSARAGTTDSDLRPGHQGGDKTASIDSYLRSTLEQHFIIAMDGGRLAGFISYKAPYRLEVLRGSKRCAYVSTVLVDPAYRGQRLVYDLYSVLFAYISASGAPVATRTWSTNHAHLHVLQELGFTLAERFPNDRGLGIDTVYYVRSFNTESYSLPHKIRAYGLTGSILATGLIFLLTVASVGLYAFSRDGQSIGAQLALAFATSLLVSASCLGIDIATQYRAMRQDQYLMDMRSFGISRLNFDKTMLLSNKIKAAHSVLWISGYRHILTSSLTWRLRGAARRGVAMRVLIAPPWLKGYRAVYGSGVRAHTSAGSEYGPCVYDNYVKFLRAIYTAYQSEGIRLDECQVRFTGAILFNDIYRVDNSFITSPYSTAREADGPRLITARNYFTLEVNEDTRLFNLTESEYRNLWETADEELDPAKFLACFPSDRFCTQIGSTDEKAALLRSAVRSVPDADRRPAASRS